MQKLVAGMEEQFKVGNISQKENVRVKSLLFSLQSDQAAVQQEMADMQKELSVLLRQNDHTSIIPVINNINTDSTGLSIPQLIDSARNNRPDLQLAKTAMLTQQHNLSYQKALKAPDVTVGVEYDKLNSYVRNYWGLTLGIPLPVFNRNRGNIIAAETAVRQSASAVLQSQEEVEQEVIAAYNKYLVAKNLQHGIGTELGASYDTLLQNMITGYQQRQVSLIEFVDFFESYKETTIKKLQQQTALRNAAAELNFTTGSAIMLIQ
jgi:cobalt-zinc-cadmium efflux system outer membrane protein